jgi:hypothetical protein
MELRGERESPPRALRVGADDDRRMRFLDRFWPGHHRLEVHEVAMILGLCPYHLYGLDTLARQLVAARESGAVVGHLVLVPAVADAEQETAARRRLPKNQSKDLQKYHRPLSPALIPSTEPISIHTCIDLVAAVLSVTYRYHRMLHEGRSGVLKPAAFRLDCPYVHLSRST